MADHLPLPEGVRLDSRRRAGRPTEDDPVARAGHASQLRRQLLEIAPDLEESEADAETGTSWLVLKFTGRTRLDAGPLHRMKMIVVGEGDGWTYAVVSSRESRRQLAKVLAEYANTTQDLDEDWDHPKTWATLLDHIEGIDLYGPDDRQDPELDELDWSRSHLIDVLLWPSERTRDADERITEVREVVERAQQRNGTFTVVAYDPRPATTVLRIRADRSLLEDLLEERWVERIRPPLQARVSLTDIDEASDLGPLPKPAGEPIGMIDGLVVTANQLLSGAVVAARSFPEGHQFSGPDRHGTAVASVAVWGDLDFTVNGVAPPVPHPTISARVLDPVPSVTTPGDQLRVAGLAHTTIEAAIRWMADEHHVRVVNISINRSRPFDSLLAEDLTVTLDTLARELKLVIVVSAGNYLNAPVGGWLAGYPGYLRGDDARIAEPGDAAIAITVGAIARRDVLGDTNSHGVMAIAPAQGPAPFTRLGPGRRAMFKPEFVHYGGNWGQARPNAQPYTDDANLAIIIATPPARGRLIGMLTGTSLAAPAVSREIARIATRYPQASANMLRALTALSARHPQPARPLVDLPSKDVSAYGQPDADRVLESHGPRAILTIDASIATNSVVVHPLPVPYEFAEGSTSRSFRVALAFDPPVRRSRREYIAGQMTVELVRGMDLDEVRRRYQIQPSVRAAEADPRLERLELPSGRRRPRLVPSVTSVKNNTLLCRTYLDGSWDPDDEHYFLVVTHNLSPWTEAQKRSYSSQDYALAVMLVDEERLGLDLHNLVRNQLRTRVRTSGRIR